MALSVIAVSVMMFTPREQVGASTIQGNDYMSTSTAASNVYGAQIRSSLLKNTPGSLGTVIVTGAAAGTINIYDATTTNITLRASSKATSTLLIASLPASLAAGDYVFDAEYTDGLYVDLADGVMPTTTITYR